MKIDGRKVELTEKEVADAVCPTNIKWAVSQIDTFGLELAAASEKLAPFARCPEVLAAANFDVTVVKDGAEASESQESPKPSDTPEV